MHSGNNNENLLSNEKEKRENGATATRSEEKPSLVSTLLSVTCIMHLYWIFIHVLRFVTFIGFINLWLEQIIDESGVEGAAKEEKGNAPR